MIDFEKIILVNYCYPDCTPLMNIMRLPKSEAFKLAEDLAKNILKQQPFIVLPILIIIMPSERVRTDIYMTNLFV